MYNCGIIKALVLARDLLAGTKENHENYWPDLYVLVQRLESRTCQTRQIIATKQNEKFDGVTYILSALAVVI
jgi:hypothetical protein